MSKYDGPSYFKKNHPKIKSLKEKEENAQKSHWTKQDSYFKNDHKKTMPKHVQTRTDLQEEAAEYMQTPSTPFKSSVPPRQMTKKANETKSRFRSKQIPKSLQHLEGWKTNSANPGRLQEVRKRLAKDKASYLLFEGYLAPVVEQKLKEELDQPLEKVASPKKKTLRSKEIFNSPKDSPKDETPKVNPHTQEKAERVQEELNHNLLKPNTGLHRSLSKIIAEDQEAMESGKNNLGSLFSERD